MTAPRSTEFPTPPMKQTKSMRIFAEAAESLGLHPYISASANLSETYTNPDGKTINQCMYCSFCERFGCDYQAKSDPLITVIPTALETGTLKFVPIQTFVKLRMTATNRMACTLRTRELVKTTSSQQILSS